MSLNSYGIYHQLCCIFTATHTFKELVDGLFEITINRHGNEFGLRSNLKQPVANLNCSVGINSINHLRVLPFLFALN